MNPPEWRHARQASHIQDSKKIALQRIVERTTPSNYSRADLNKTLVAIIIGLLSFVSSETVLAVQRPPYPVKAEAPDAGHWVITSTNKKQDEPSL